MLAIDLYLPLDRFVLSVAVELGRTAAVLGPSGAGKSSLLEAVAGLRRARGSVILERTVLQDTSRGIFLPPERRRIGYVPQEALLFPHLSVRANLQFGSGRETAGPGSPPFLDYGGLVDALELGSLLRRFPRHLSGGERRRVALGRALLAAPRLLLVDEPTAGLDPRRARRALGQIRDLTERFHVPLLVVTHREEEARTLAQDIVVLEEGRVIAAGATSRVLRDPEVLAERAEEVSENVVVGRVLAHDPEGGVTRVQLRDGPEVAIPYQSKLAQGLELLLALRAEEIMLATENPRGLSARNAWSGHIDEVIPAHGSVYVRVGDWLIHVTPAAARELNLAKGSPVWLVVKTHSWRVVAD
jgi:molybdate transport system ATP-binding protein